MRSAVSGLLAALGVAASANASPAVHNINVHNPNFILAAGGCGLGFYRTMWGCTSYRYGFIVPGTAYSPYWSSGYYPYPVPYYYPYYYGGDNPQTQPSGHGS